MPIPVIALTTLAGIQQRHFPQTPAMPRIPRQQADRTSTAAAIVDKYPIAAALALGNTVTE
jgi:hypothetical protein